MKNVRKINLKINEESKKIALFLIIIGCFVSNFLAFRELLIENRNLYENVEIASSNFLLTQDSLEKERMKSISLEDNLKIEKETNFGFRNQIETISSAVGVLEKLSKTDSELLKKYSKVYFLNENYIPQKLSPIPQEYLYEKNKTILAHSDIIDNLVSMLYTASSTGLNIVIVSGYRSFNEQESLKSNYKVTYGTGANKFSADQGYSEHQLGTTFDFSTNKLGPAIKNFNKTPEYNWLVQNAHRFGFTLSYPEKNSYYVFEPWHWRYVGASLATKLFQEKKFFYDMDQRTIDEYLISIFEN